MRWTRTTLLTACEAILADPAISLRLRTIRAQNVTSHVDATFTPKGEIEHGLVTLDPALGGLIECALHEALHLALGPVINANFNDALEEVVIRALERDLWVMAMRSKRRVARWRRLLNAKLSPGPRGSSTAKARSGSTGMKRGRGGR